MKRLVAMTMLLVLSLVCTSAAMAKTVDWAFNIQPSTSSSSFNYGYPADKADNEARFYVTGKSNGFPDTRDVFFRAVHSDGTGGGGPFDIAPLVSKIVTLGKGKTSGNAAYNISVKKGDTFKLAARANISSGDSSPATCTGRWTP